MNFYKLSLCVCVSFQLSACHFNGTFHRPTLIDPIEKLTHYYSDKDTLYIDVNQDNQKIVLKDSGFKIINANYSIRNEYFESSSGNRLNAWVLTPTNIDPIATVLHFHGSAGNLLTQYQLITPLIDFGYQIFMFDYSGYGSSEGKASHQSVLQDAYSALQYLKDSDIVDTNLILYGQSYGGYLAAVVGSNSQQECDAIVIEGTFSSFKDQARHSASFFGNFVKNDFMADKEINKNYKPLLVIHSTEDKLVPIRLGRKIYDNANQTKDFYKIDGPHISGLENYSNEIAARIKQLINN